MNSRATRRAAAVGSYVVAMLVLQFWAYGEPGRVPLDSEVSSEPDDGVVLALFAAAHLALGAWAKEWWAVLLPVLLVPILRPWFGDFCLNSTQERDCLEWAVTVSFLIPVAILCVAAATFVRIYVIPRAAPRA